MAKGHSESNLRPLIAHVIYRLDIGGLENGLVNLLNRLPAEEFRHAIICIKDYSEFRNRITRDIPVYALHKKEGKDPALYKRLFLLLKEIRPDILHTRNLATLEAQFPALLTGVRCRIHGEHGRDIEDVAGTNRKLIVLRKIHRPLIHRYVTVSADLELYLRDSIGVPARKITHICNGVDTQKFSPSVNCPSTISATGFEDSNNFVIGTVGRMEPVKNQTALAHAFVYLINQSPEVRQRLRLIMVGDGSILSQVRKILDDAGCSELAWLTGSRNDVPELLRKMDVFVLPSLVEGVSNTILEAMASGLPVVATQVGGNSELVVENHTGYLVPANNPKKMAEAISRYQRDPNLLNQHGKNARVVAETRFSIDYMVDQYAELYDQLLRRRGKHTYTDSHGKIGASTT